MFFSYFKLNPELEKLGIELSKVTRHETNYRGTPRESNSLNVALAKYYLKSL